MDPLSLGALGLLLSVFGCSAGFGSDCANLTPSRPPLYTYPVVTSEDRATIRHLTIQAAIVQMGGRMRELTTPESVRRILSDSRISSEDRYFFDQFATVLHHVDMAHAPRVPGPASRPGPRLRGHWDRYDSRHIAWYSEVAMGVVGRNIVPLAQISDMRVLPQLHPAQVLPPSSTDRRERGLMATQVRRAHRNLDDRSRRRLQVKARDGAYHRQLLQIWRAQGSPDLFPGAEHPPRDRSTAASSSDPVAPDLPADSPVPPVATSPPQDQRSIDDLVAMIQGGPTPAPPRNSRRSRGRS